MGKFVDTIQVRVKNTSQSMTTFLLRLLTAGVLGIVFAVIGEVMIGYGSLSFTLVLVAIGGAFLRIARNWSAFSILIFDFICVLIGMLLRMYIMIAPGA